MTSKSIADMRDVVANLWRVPTKRARILLADDSHFAVDPQTPLAVTVWLDPLEPPEELRPEAISAKLRPGYTMLHGHVSDVQAGRPLAIRELLAKV